MNTMNETIAVGDVVRVSKDAPRMYTSGADSICVGADCKVLEIEDDNAIIKADEWLLAIPTKYLIKVMKIKEGDKVRHIRDGVCGIVSKCGNNTCVVEFGNGLCCYAHLDNFELVQTSEQMEADAKNMAKHGEIQDDSDRQTKIQPIIIPVEVYIQDGYWEEYTVKLAHDIVIKLANKYTADFVKAVVENLKKK